MDKSDPASVLARTVYGECRSGGRPGMEAVAAVIMNRARNPRWWGGPDVISVCLCHAQFSCWNAGDPNRAVIERATGADPAFVTALAVANEALAGRLADPTGNADSYYAEGSPEPAWARTAAYTGTIAGQRFYRTELPPLPTADSALAADIGKLETALTKLRKDVGL